MKHVTLSTKSLPVIGDILREVRAERQISQEDVAKKIGSKQPFISEMESNRIVPTLPSLLKYMKAINCKIIIVIE